MDPPINRMETCAMVKTTTIDFPDFEISTPHDETIEGLEFGDNRKISYLPIKVHETFPNLVHYLAARCSIKAIKKENFASLTKLTLIQMYNNQIEAIDSDTFTGLDHLNFIDFSKLTIVTFNIPKLPIFSVKGWNKIKKMHGDAFVGLKRLKTLLLRSNECIARSNYH